MLYRFQIEISDIDRNIYQTVDFRVSQHPSETLPYLLTRVLAFALSYEEGLEFSAQGLGDPDAPCLQTRSGQGGVDLWVEIGNPSARKLHKASKAARRVQVYTYKRPEILLQEMAATEIHKAKQIQIFSFAPAFLDELESHLEKNNRWTLLHDGGALNIGMGERTFAGEMKSHHE